MVFVAPALDRAGAAGAAIRWSGVALLFACLFGRVWCSLYISGRKGSEIVRSGPYALCRNPLYVFSMLGAWGVGAQSGSLAVAALCAALTWAVFRVVVFHEEEFLTVRHGASFEDYASEVPRFLPRALWTGYDGQIPVEPRLVMRTALDSALFFLAVPVFAVIEQAQRSGLVDALIVLP
nr:isoprenylcysteine carboxylmethyltransferase family protein [Alsobacter ponti]